jgi:hypothetical protein
MWWSSSLRWRAIFHIQNSPTVEPLQRSYRKMYARGVMSLLHDVRYGIRVLLKSPGVLVAAVLSLALGIGANATIFTMINTVFLQPLPVEKPSELMYVYGTDSANAQNAVLGAFHPLSYPKRKTTCSWTLAPTPFRNESALEAVKSRLR